MDWKSFQQQQPVGSGDSSTEGDTVVTTDAPGTKLGVDSERRLVWLEEDVQQLHRRLLNKCSDAAGSNPDGTGLQAQLACLENELSVERRARESMEARVDALEGALHREREDRSTQARDLSIDLQKIVQGLIDHIENVLAVKIHDIEKVLAEKDSMTLQNSCHMEEKLVNLINRVDQGLSAGVTALHDQLTVSASFQTPGGGAGAVGGLPSPKLAHRPTDSLAPQGAGDAGPVRACQEGALDTGCMSLKTQMPLEEGRRRPAAVSRAAAPQIQSLLAQGMPGAGSTPTSMGNTSPTWQRSSADASSALGNPRAAGLVDSVDQHTLKTTMTTSRHIGVITRASSPMPGTRGSIIPGPGLQAGTLPQGVTSSQIATGATSWASMLGVQAVRQSPFRRVGDP